MGIGKSIFACWNAALGSAHRRQRSGVAPNPVGYNRVYVNVNGEFSYDAWWENLREGRVFITNGPLLRVSVEGQPPGHVFRGRERRKLLNSKSRLTLSTREREIHYLEISSKTAASEVHPHGRIHRRREKQQTSKIEFKGKAAGSSFAARLRFPEKLPFRPDRPVLRRDRRPARISKRSLIFLDWVYERAAQISSTTPEQQRNFENITASPRLLDETGGNGECGVENLSRLKRQT